jgi:hypothetical protein
VIQSHRVFIFLVWKVQTISAALKKWSSSGSNICSFTSSDIKPVKLIECVTKLGHDILFMPTIDLNYNNRF